MANIGGSNYPKNQNSNYQGSYNTAVKSNYQTNTNYPANYPTNTNQQGKIDLNMNNQMNSINMNNGGKLSSDQNYVVGS